MSGEETNPVDRSDGMSVGSVATRFTSASGLPARDGALVEPHDFEEDRHLLIEAGEMA